MFEALKEYVENCQVYPPSELFYNKYGKDAKAEKRIQELCESVYRFTFPDGVKSPIGELTSTFRELEVLFVLRFEGMKPERIKDVSDKFLEAVQYAQQELDALAKKDQLLKQYFDGIKVKYQTIKSMVYDLTKDYV